MLEGSNRTLLQAAEGWLALGNLLEANEELERISPTLRAHPEVLEIRCRIYEAAEQWEMGLVVASSLSEQVPSRKAACFTGPGVSAILGNARRLMIFSRRLLKLFLTIGMCNTILRYMQASTERVSKQRQSSVKNHADHAISCGY